MKKTVIFIIFFTFFSMVGVLADVDISGDIYTDKNKLFSLTIPEKLNGTYEVQTEKGIISIFHKESKKAGFGGFAFGIKAYKSPADHAFLPGGRKIGELTDKKGRLYDMVIKYPTDVQYDYTSRVNPPESYKLLYDLGEVVNIEGINGSTYYKNQGTKGEELYKEVLMKHITAISEKWDSNKLEKENMSYMYNVVPKDKIGYTYYDVNADGIEELLIGEISDYAWKGVIYDIYTMVNREPQHVVSGGSRDRYYVCDNAFICNEYSSGANESGVLVYGLMENATELYEQVGFKYDAYEDKNNPWFIRYGFPDYSWKKVPEGYFKERKQTFEEYERFDFVPLCGALNGFQTLEDKYNPTKDYFDYSVVLTEFPKKYYYTTVKISKSKERILIVTDKINEDKNSYRGLFYYFAKNGFVYPLGLIESKKPLAQSKNYLYFNDGNGDIKFYVSDKKLEMIKSGVSGVNGANEAPNADVITFETIKSADKFTGDFGEPAGDDVVKATLDGFYFEYHKPQYKKKYIKNLMKECIQDGVKTQVQMYCSMVKKLQG